jgi:pantetheine-phosphate adenylyltransferase
MPVAMCPGSFDPIHRGHLDVIRQANELFGSVVVVTMFNPAKLSGLFDLEQRQAMITESLGEEFGSDQTTVTVASFPGLAIDAADAVGATVIVKGLRNAADFDIELQMALTNHSVSGIRTVFVPCRPDLSYLSSRFIREIAQYGGDVTHMVPASVARRLAALPRR